MEQSDRAIARATRLAQFARSVAFRTKGGQNAEVVAHFEHLQRVDPTFAKRATERQRRSGAIANAYRLNGADLYVDRYVRDFLTEYNSRILRGEGANMPSPFNVMRAFVDSAEDALILRLLPEKVSP